MTNLFERLSKERPTPNKKTQEPLPAQKLLDWLMRWPQPTVYTRDILIFGPYIVRNRKNAIDATETLVRHGWLIPQKKRNKVTGGSGKSSVNPLFAPN
jgi:hypothetical protein